MSATVTVRSDSTPVQGASVQVQGSSLQVSPSSKDLGTVNSGGTTFSTTVTVPGTDKPGASEVVTATAWAPGTSATKTAYLTVGSIAAGGTPGGAAGAAAPPNLPSGFLPNGSSGGAATVLPPEVAMPQVAPEQGERAPVTVLRSASTPLGVQRLTLSNLATVEGGWLGFLLLGNGVLVLRLWLVRRHTRADLQKHAETARRRRLGAGRRPRPTDVNAPRQPRQRRLISAPVRGMRLASGQFAPDWAVGVTNALSFLEA